MRLDIKLRMPFAQRCKWRQIQALQTASAHKPYVKVYHPPLPRPDEHPFLVGYRGHQFMETGMIVAAPYIPIP